METYNSIEVTKQLVKDGKISQEIAETIFPQLKESEDEKTRKNIITFLDELFSLGKNAFFDKWSKSDCAKWVAWLERQGEQKEQREHVWTLQEAAPGDILNSTRVQATIIFKGFNPDGKHIDAYCALQKGIFIHQELPWDMDWEPAPIFWIVELFRRMNESGYMWNPEEQELVNIKQKPAEWSEDDEGIVSRIMTDLDNCESEWGSSKEEEKEWLESLKGRVQPQPKSDWNNNDEISFNRLMAICADANVRKSSVFSEKEIKDLMDWLESIKKRVQPQWKPSDEQMKCLLNAEGVLRADSRIAMAQKLSSLYNDLKKLTE